MKKSPGKTWALTMLWAHVLNGTEILVPMTKIPICQVKIGILRDRYAAVSQNPAEGVNIHAVHQASLGEIVPQGVRRVGFFYSSPSQIPLEAGLEGMDLQRKPRLFREK